MRRSRGVAHEEVMTGDCIEDNIFQILDPTAFLEIDFEAEVVKALTCLFPDYWCGVFAGTFLLEGERRSADLALIHKSLSHWFVVEVELAGHSLDQHVLPQVRCFRYGEPDQTCASSLLAPLAFSAASKRTPCWCTSHAMLQSSVTCLTLNGLQHYGLWMFNT